MRFLRLVHLLCTLVGCELCPERMPVRSQLGRSESGNDAGISYHTVQTITFDAKCDTGKFFALTYKDSYGGEWVTRPISPACTTSDMSDDALNGNARLTCEDIKTALTELPNFIIPNVTSSFTDGLNQSQFRFVIPNYRRSIEAACLHCRGCNLGSPTSLAIRSSPRQ